MAVVIALLAVLELVVLYRFLRGDDNALARVIKHTEETSAEKTGARSLLNAGDAPPVRRVHSHSRYRQPRSDDPYFRAGRIGTVPDVGDAYARKARTV